MPMPARLHLGFGPRAAAGWINVDRIALAEVEVVDDPCVGLPFAERSLDAAVAVHVLQDLPWGDVPRALEELRRVLRPGGVLRLGLPDLDRSIDAYRGGDPGCSHVPDEDAASIGAKPVTRGGARAWPLRAPPPAAVAGRSSAWPLPEEGEGLPRHVPDRTTRRPCRPPRARLPAVLVISPHLDDGVFGCGGWLAGHPGSTVLTVFAGAPRSNGPLTEWDARSGFSSGSEAVRERREEDRRALALLEATPCWLEFADSQYGASPSVEAVAGVLRDELSRRRPDFVLYPLGLFHSDHRLVHDACRRALAGLDGVESAAYEDALYRGLRGLLQDRLAALAAAGVVATPVEAQPPRSAVPRAPVDLARAAQQKAHAVAAYASQLRAFGAGGHADLDRPERAWALEPAPGEREVRRA